MKNKQLIEATVVSCGNRHVRDRLLAGILTCFACIPALLAHPITPGDILIPLAPHDIQELKPGTLVKVQTIPLPSGYIFHGSQVSTVLVRSSDHHIFANVRDHAHSDMPTLLELDSSGGFISALHPESGTIALHQLIFDPADSTQETVLGPVFKSSGGFGDVDALKPSTFSVSVKLSLADANFAGIARDSLGNIYVGNYITGIIEEYSSLGAYIKAFAKVTDAGSSHTILGMTFDDTDNLYVAQSDAHKVLKFSSKGVFLAAFMYPHSVAPIGVFFNHADHLLYVGDDGLPFITVLKTDGTFVTDDTSGPNVLYPAGTSVGQATVVPGLVPPTGGCSTAAVSVYSSGCAASSIPLPIVCALSPTLVTPTPPVVYFGPVVDLGVTYYAYCLLPAH